MTNERLVPFGLVLILALQVFAMAFFLVDAAEELAHDPTGLHPLTEALVALGLGFGLISGALALVRSLRTAQSQGSALALASGEFLRVIEAQFEAWHLTPAEREIALLSLRGHELERIAEIRGAAVGTIRAQLAKIYGKSGTSNRAQLSAVFVAQLMDAAAAPPPG